MRNEHDAAAIKADAVAIILPWCRSDASGHGLEGLDTVVTSATFSWRQVPW